MSNLNKALFLEEFYPKKYFQITDVNQETKKILIKN